MRTAGCGFTAFRTCGVIRYLAWTKRNCSDATIRSRATFWVRTKPVHCFCAASQQRSRPRSSRLELACRIETCTISGCFRHGSGRMTAASSLVRWGFSVRWLRGAAGHSTPSSGRRRTTRSEVLLSEMRPARSTRPTTAEPICSFRLWRTGLRRRVATQLGCPPGQMVCRRAEAIRARLFQHRRCGTPGPDITP